MYGASNMKKPAPKRWFLHYNKPESRKAGRNVLTLHWDKACHMVNHFVTVNVDSESHENKRQPRCVIRGFAKSVRFLKADGLVTAVISGV